jgi:hypothetical protein
VEPAGDVILDVVFDDGLLFLELANLGPRPALGVSCRFEQPLVGLDGRDVANLPLFRRVPFLGPGRRIRTLLDTSAAYFAREAPTRVVVVVRYRADDGREHSRRIEHDLAIYRDVAYLVARS